MSIINAFLSTWSHTRRSFGAGTPVRGAQYSSDRLGHAESILASAAPGSHWSGSAATEYAAANTKQRHAIGHFAAVDHRFRSEVDRSADVTDARRRDLDTVRKQVIDAAANTPQGETGERLRLAIAQKGFEQLREIIHRSIAESRDIAQRIRGLRDEYLALDFQQTPEHESAIRGVDFKTDTPDEPPPLIPGQPVDPASNPFIGDERFGYWVNMNPLPSNGTRPSIDTSVPSVPGRHAAEDWRHDGLVHAGEELGRRPTGRQTRRAVPVPDCRPRGNDIHEDGPRERALAAATLGSERLRVPTAQPGRRQQ